MTNHHVAIMEDDPALCLLLADLVREAGYDPHIWSLDEDPWAFIHRVQPQLIVLDLWLRERGDGVAFLADLRRDATTEQVPVVVCSADPHALDVQVAQCGYARCTVLAKPFDLDVFLGLVNDALAQPSTAWQERRAHPHGQQCMRVDVRGKRRGAGERTV